MVVLEVILIVLGVLFCRMGCRLRQGDLSLIHDYHQQNLRPSDRSRYGRMWAAAMFILAAGLFAAAAFLLLFGKIGLLIVVPFFGCSLTLMIIIQRRFNGGIF